jgi:uncharacterized protein YbaR (Trm112 family)
MNKKATCPNCKKLLVEVLRLSQNAEIIYKVFPFKEGLDYEEERVITAENDEFFCSNCGLTFAYEELRKLFQCKF